MGDKPRICPKCPGVEFKGPEEHADHLQGHEPTPAMWAEAYGRILRGRERVRQGERGNKEVEQ